MAVFHRTSRILLAAFTPNHELLIHSTNGNTGQFVSHEKFTSMLTDAGISRVAFMRHGKTGPAQNGIDFDRLLTDEGRDQARQAGLVFGGTLNPLFPTILVSPAPRTVETAKIFLSQVVLENHEQFELDLVDALYDGTMQPKGPGLFQKLGYAPLREYLENDNDVDRAIAQELLGSYAHTCIDALVDVVSRRTGMTPSSQRVGGDHVSTIEDNDGLTILMVGHAIYLPAAALGVSSLIGCSDMDVIMNTNTREAEGYLIDMETRSVKYLSRE